MKKLLFVLAIALIIGTAYLSYEKWGKYANITAWNFIPVDAAFVLETELLDDYNTLKGYSIWENMSKIDGFNAINEGIEFLDSINGSGGFQAIFKKAPTLISVHKVSSHQFDCLFVLDIQNISQNTFVGATIGRLEAGGYRFKTRNYNGYTISEISKSGEVFTYIFYKNFLLASFTPYLVEDAIRTIEGEQIPFNQVYLKSEPSNADGQMEIHANYNQVDGLLSGMANEDFSLSLKSGSYSLAVDSSFLNLTGFTEESEGWLATHKQPPATFDMAEVIPENTAYVYHVSNSAMEDWKNQQMTFLENNQPKIKGVIDSLVTTYDFRSDQILDLVDEEIGLVTIEGGTARNEKRLCILELKNTQEALDYFHNLTERVSISLGDSVYTESYSDNEIRYLPIRDFPQTFLGAIAGTFEQCFYVNHRNYLIISNDLQELKSVIYSIQNEDTWGKSLRMNEFLERTNNTANFSLFINLPRTLNSVQPLLNPTWSEHLKDNLSTYQNFELAACQFSYLGDQFFTNFTLTQPIQKSTSIPKTNSETGIRFASKLVIKPFLLRTHAYKGFDILLQDSANVVYYLDPNQNTLWTKEIDGKIISDLFPIDFYKNGKIQYAFATRNQVHIFDRTGSQIPGFPKSVNEIAIQHFKVIDYDLSRNYRMAITDESGNTYLTDKELRGLDGWSPRSFNRAALQPLRHQRLGRRDIMISLQQNGVVNITNRRSENLRGFPFETNQVIDKHYFLKANNALGNSSITLISKAGELIEINIEGDVVQRTQLLKTSPNAVFRLVPDRNNKSFLIVRHEGSQYDILDDTGNVLFSKDYFTEGEILIQYYEFGAGRDLIVFTDTSSETLYIYDNLGNLLTGNPLPSANEVSILYSSVNREFQVFTTSGSNLELFTFKY